MNNIEKIEKIAVTYAKGLKNECKPNPFNYPIVDKWNYKYIWKPNMRIIFSFIRLMVDERMKEVLNDGYYNQFCDIKQFPY